MMSAWLIAHAANLAHGLAAALFSIIAFYIAGLLLFPRRWSAALRWPDSILTGLAFYAALCWVGTTSRHIPLYYVALVFAGSLWALIALRFRWLQTTFAAAQSNNLRRWVGEFCILYGFAYALASPAPGALLTLPQDGALNLVTYARYAKQLLASGTADIQFSSFDYWKSPAGAYLLAWHSLPFVGDPLDAAVPALVMLTALFGMTAAEISRCAWRLSRGASMAVGVIAVCAPMCRWALTSYAPDALLAATCVMYLAGVAAAAVVARRARLEFVVKMLAGCVLLYLSARGVIKDPGGVVAGLAEAARYFSPLAVFGLPGRTAVDYRPAHLGSAAIVLLPFVPMIWSALIVAIRQSSWLDRIAVSAADRTLARAFVVYIGAGVVIGNVTVHAFASPVRERWPAAWRQLSQGGRVPFRSLTLKVGDEPGGVATALAMYYLPARKAEVIGRGVSLGALVFDNVSRQEPMFIQNFGCEGVGHGDTVSARGVGCLLMAPPTMVEGAAYPFNRTFLFVRFDRMTARETGGRWNTAPTLNLVLNADPQRVRLDREMFVNFLVNPFLAVDAEPFRLSVRWGKDRHGVIAVRERQWLSLPVASNDWSGNRIWAVPVAIAFPDGRTILFQEVALTESPRGALPQPLAP
jgi:hypothetical protein